MIEEVKYRKTEHDDGYAFKVLLDKQGGQSTYKAAFGTFNFSGICEYSVDSVVAMLDHTEPEKRDMLVIGALSDIPSYSADNGQIEIVDEVLRQFAKFEAYNTLFLTYWMIDDTLSPQNKATITNSIIRRFFSNQPDVHNIVWLCPSRTNIPDELSAFLQPIDLSLLDRKSAESFKGKSVYFINRERALPILRVREARVEDNDELLPILRYKYSSMMGNQEEFFLSDVITSQDQRNKFFVGFDETKAVGMIATSLDINSPMLTKVYDVSSFPNILVKREKVQIAAPDVILLSGDFGILNKIDLSGIGKMENVVMVDARNILKSIPFIDTDEDTAKEAMQLIKDHFDGLKRDWDNAHDDDNKANAFILVGFPRSDSEAIELSQSSMRFNSVIEVFNPDDPEYLIPPGEAELRQSLLDSLETLFEILEEGTQSADKFSIDIACWKKFDIGEADVAGEQDMRGAIKKMLEKRTQIVAAQRTLEESALPEVRAFAITLFCIKDEFESRAVDLLDIAFEEFADHEYAIYLVPSNAAPSRLTERMMKADLRPGISFDQTLYILHRSALTPASIELLPFSTLDHLHDVEDFIAPLGEEAKEIADFTRKSSSGQSSKREMKDNPMDSSLVVMSGSLLLGYIGLSRRYLSSEDINWLSANYKLDEFVHFDHHRLRSQTQIIHWVLSPILLSWTRLIMKEIMRLCDKTLIYYQTKNNMPPPRELQEKMIPIAPRIRMQPFLSLSRDAQLVLVPYQERISAPEYATGSELLCFSKRCLSTDKVTVNPRVVIIGGNPSSYALLELLCLCKGLHVGCISFVVENPPSYLDSNNNAQKYNRDADDCYSGCLSPRDLDVLSPQYTKSLGLADRVVLINGSLTDIDRKNRAVVISEDVVLEYDILVIAPQSKDSTPRAYPSSKYLSESSCAQRGIIGLGSRGSDELAVSWANSCLKKSDHRIVLAGRGLDALTALGNLIRLGVDHRRIILVIEEGQADSITFDENSLAQAISALAEKADLLIYRGYKVHDVKLSSEAIGSIVGVILSQTQASNSGPAFASANQSLHAESDKKGGASKADVRAKAVKDADGFVILPCVALFTCGHNECPRGVFSAVNECGLIYDGGLVVDETFRTVDPYIFAVGDITKFSRIYRKATPHGRFNPREIGMYVGAQILAKYLDPGSDIVDFSRPPSTAHDENVSFAGSFFSLASNLIESYQRQHLVSEDQLPKFILPKATSYLLPDGLTLFQARLPTYSKTTYSLVTDSIEDSFNFSAILKVDNLGTVVEFLSLRRERIEEINLSRIVGWHESYLNSSIQSYETKRVTDWVAFFRSDWVAALLHEKFSDLAQNLRNILQTDKGTFLALEHVLEKVEFAADNESYSIDGIDVSTMTNEILGEAGTKLPEHTKKTVEDYGMMFLRKNKNGLPRFALPTNNR